MKGEVTDIEHDEFPSIIHIAQVPNRLEPQCHCSRDDPPQQSGLRIILLIRPIELAPSLHPQHYPQGRRKDNWEYDPVVLFLPKVTLIIKDDESDIEIYIHVGVVVGESAPAVSQNEVVDVLLVQIEFCVAGRCDPPVLQCMVVGVPGSPITFLLKFLFPLCIFH